MIKIASCKSLLTQLRGYQVYSHCCFAAFHTSSASYTRQHVKQNVQHVQSAGPFQPKFKHPPIHDTPLKQPEAQKTEYNKHDQSKQRYKNSDQAKQQYKKYAQPQPQPQLPVWHKSRPLSERDNIVKGPKSKYKQVRGTKNKYASNYVRTSSKDLKETNSLSPRPKFSSKYNSRNQDRYREANSDNLEKTSAQITYDEISNHEQDQISKPRIYNENENSWKRLSKVRLLKNARGSIENERDDDNIDDGNDDKFEEDKNEVEDDEDSRTFRLHHHTLTNGQNKKLLTTQRGWKYLGDDSAAAIDNNIKAPDLSSFQEEKPLNAPNSLPSSVDISPKHTNSKQSSYTVNGLSFIIKCRTQSAEAMKRVEELSTNTGIPIGSDDVQADMHITVDEVSWIQLHTASSMRKLFHTSQKVVIQCNWKAEHRSLMRNHYSSPFVLALSNSKKINPVLSDKIIEAESVTQDHQLPLTGTNVLDMAAGLCSASYSAAAAGATVVACITHPILLLMAQKFKEFNIGKDQPSRIKSACESIQFSNKSAIDMLSILYSKFVSIVTDESEVQLVRPDVIYFDLTSAPFNSKVEKQDNFKSNIAQRRILQAMFSKEDIYSQEETYKLINQARSIATKRVVVKRADKQAKSKKLELNGTSSFSSFRNDFHEAIINQYNSIGNEYFVLSIF